MSIEPRVWKKNERWFDLPACFRGKAPASLYRYMPLVQLLSMLEGNCISLMNPVTWPDKCEAGWIHRLFDSGSPIEGSNVRAVCYTTAAYCEAMWHVYARMLPVVRVRFATDELANALRDFRAIQGKFYLGEVEYTDSSNMREAFMRERRDGQAGKSQSAAKLMLLKRRAFSYENEVRLLFITQEKCDDVIHVPTDVGRLITQVLVSPYAEDWMFAAIQTLISRTYNLRSTVERSSLDRAPSWMSAKQAST